MQRSILAFAIAAAILASAATVSTGQRATTPVRTTAAKKKPVTAQGPSRYLAGKAPAVCRQPVGR